MDLTPWAPVIALGGVALGSVLTFVGQWLTRRQTSELSIASQKSALRDDRREAIYRFLEALQTCHNVMAREKYGIGDADLPEIARATGELWFRLSCLKLLCSVELINSANACTAVVAKAMGGDRQAWFQMTGVEADLMMAARLELYSAEAFE